jgi:tRNA nucleotidyltransferase (CCA-adding enzyme)
MFTGPAHPFSRVPRVVREFAGFLTRAGFQCYLVGGAVRDILLRRPLSDFDIATDAQPKDVQQVFRRVIPTGIKHGTVTVLWKGTRFEVTTFRIDRDYSDGRRPDTVVFIPSIEEDLKRRDFSINSMAYDLHGGRLLDPHGGQQDLKAGLIRAIGDPLERFREDGLRPVRACRFAAQFEFHIDGVTFAAIGRCLDTVRKVSAERIRDELVRLLQAAAPSLGFRLMAESGLLDLILPELGEGRGVAQGELHRYDVFEHLLHACDAAPRENQTVRLAALLHDVGKPRCVRPEADGRPSFHGHERVSAQMTEAALRRLRFPTQLIDAVAHLVEQHMFLYQDSWSDAAVRRLVARVGETNLPNMLALRRADQLAMAGGYFVSGGLLRLEKRIEAVLAAEKALRLQDLAVNGDDLIRELGIAPGPAIGTLLAALLESVLDDPALNRKDSLLRIARGFYEERLKTR